MAIYKLEQLGSDISDSRLVEAARSSLDLESHLEGWLERSPWAIAEEPLLLIGRQTTASIDESTRYPDLLALDADGNLVIVELKKGKTPRDVVAQLLEYAAWASDLSEDEVRERAEVYLEKQSDGKTLTESYAACFDLEEVPPLNRKLRLFVAAETIEPTVARVCRFLRSEHGMDVNCIQFDVYQTEAGETLVNSERVVGQEDVVARKANREASSRWSGDKPVKVVVWEAAQEVAARIEVFTTNDVAEEILKIYPDFKKTTVRCQLISDCVGHSSRHHYPGGKDRYWLAGKGQYVLFDAEKHGTPQERDASA